MVAELVTWGCGRRVPRVWGESAGLFILLTGSLAEQKLVILIKSRLSLFPFVVHVFCVKSKNSFPSP